MRGSKVHDVIKPVDEWTDEGRTDGWVRPWQRRTNNTGGFEGGMTTGEPIIAQFAIKPIATLSNPLPTVDLGFRPDLPGALRAQRRLRRARGGRYRRVYAGHLPGRSDAGEVRGRPHGGDPP